MKISKSTNIALSPEDVWREVQTPNLLQHIAWPLIQFHFVDPATFTYFNDRERFKVSLKLLGIVPLGEQWIVPSIHAERPESWPKRLRDNGFSKLVKTWDHWITIMPNDNGGTRYTDEIEVQAGIFAPVVWAFAWVFYRHRQHRWRGLARTLAARRLVAVEHEAFERAIASNDVESAWQALERIHIITQIFAGLHIRSHLLMLSYAWKLRDWKEFIGQLFRLALAPIGNLTGRLPYGNTGRSNVSAFEPMELPTDLSAKLQNFDPL